MGAQVIVYRSDCAAARERDKYLILCMAESRNEKNRNEKRLANPYDDKNFINSNQSVAHAPINDSSVATNSSNVGLVPDNVLGISLPNKVINVGDAETTSAEESTEQRPRDRRVSIVVGIDAGRDERAPLLNSPLAVGADVRGRRSNLSSRGSDMTPLTVSDRQYTIYFPRRLIPLMMLSVAIFLQSFFDQIINITVLSAAARESWSAGDVALIVDSFEFGYGVSSLIGGAVSYRFGFKTITGVGVVAHALLTMVTPFIITSWGGLMVLRAACGVAEGCVFPSAYTMIRCV
jgi:hypothetical protein